MPGKAKLQHRRKFSAVATDAPPPRLVSSKQAKKEAEVRDELNSPRVGHGITLPTLRFMRPLGDDK